MSDRKETDNCGKDGMPEEKRQTIRHEGQARSKERESQAGKRQTIMGKTECQTGKSQTVMGNTEC
jgi:hypothetical protein